VIQTPVRLIQAPADYGDGLLGRKIEMLEFDLRSIQIPVLRPQVLTI
jgi:hypothetical protein